MRRPSPLHQLARERAETGHLHHVGDDDLVRVVVGADVALTSPLVHLARSTPLELAQQLGVTTGQATRLASAFELGRRGAWSAPPRGMRCLDPATVANVMRDVAHEEHEEFHVVLLDVRGRLLGRRLVARGSLTQCPVSPRDALRPAVRDGAHGVVFVHNHPSGDPSPSFEDAGLTERLRAAAELVGVAARDHVIVSTSGYFSFVEAGRWVR